MTGAFLTLVSAMALPMTAEFKSGDQFHGRLQAIREDSFQWKSESLAEDARFHLSDLAEIRIPTAREPALPEGEHTARAVLSNGDELRGLLLALDDEKIVLGTHYAGELTLRRDMVASLDVRDRAATIYRGPEGLDGWTQDDEGSWKYTAGALICESNGGIRRDVGKHLRLRIGLDVTWNERTDLSIRTHATEDEDERIKTYYELACQNQYISFRKRTLRPNGTSQIYPIGALGAGAVDELNREGSVRIEMLQDIEHGLFRLAVGDRVVADWRDTDPSPEGAGPFFELRSQSAGATVSRIHLESWDGILEGGFQERRGFLDESESPPPIKEDLTNRIILRNGDVIDGGIRDIAHGSVTITSTLKDFTLPVSRLRTFALRTEEEASDPEKFWKPIRRNGDIRAWFADGGHVTFGLEDLRDGKLIGSSQTFGEAAFDFGVFRRIEFNLYDSPVWFTR